MMCGFSAILSSGNQADRRRFHGEKLRNSHQREEIYRYLFESDAHPSAELIYSDLRADMPGLSLGTVYRNLKLLEELGKVRRIAGTLGTERYDACCGSIRDLEGANLAEIRPALRLDASCCIERFDISVTSLCANCAAKLIWKTIRPANAGRICAFWRREVFCKSLLLRAEKWFRRGRNGKLWVYYK